MQYIGAMKKSVRFSSVLKIAEAKEKKAITALGEAQNILQSHIDRLEELGSYQQDYRQQLQHSGSKGMDAKRLVEFHRFLDSLTLAIAQQESVVNVSRAAVEEKRQLWFAARNKLKSYGNVMSRYELEEQLEQDSREQRECDELSIQVRQGKFRE